MVKKFDDVREQTRAYLAESLLQAVYDQKIGPQKMKDVAQKILDKTENVSSLDETDKIIEEFANKYTFMKLAQTERLKEKDQDESQKILDELTKKLQELE